MKKVLILASFGLLILSMSVSAQAVNTDSLTLISKISDDQLKLGKLQNQVDQKTQNKQDASVKAQKSADDNSTAAGKLSDNPEDRKLAKSADNKASDARSDSKNARKEAGRLDKLNKDMQDLKNKIADNQVKLDKYTQAGLANRAMLPVPMKVDTTQH